MTTNTFKLIIQKKQEKSTNLLVWFQNSKIAKTLLITLTAILLSLVNFWLSISFVSLSLIFLAYVTLIHFMEYISFDFDFNAEIEEDLNRDWR